MAREIIHIPAQQRLTNRATEVERPLRVAAYCRVSTEQDEQLNSFENQVSYYTDYINRNPRYTMAGVYSDEGVSGTSTRRRKGFQQMIKDCQAGEIDLIVTKSISRFARNTQDCLNYTRELKDLGIAVFFEKEGVNTMEATGELLFTILSSLAQDESRSISENSQWGIRSLFRNGVLHLNTNRFLGYDKDADGHLVINKEQAPIVERIYNEFLGGTSPDVIARRLNEDQIKGVTGEVKWKVGTIMGILRNEKYMGDCILQKTFTVNYLTKKTVKNEGQLEMTHIKGDHEPIIEPWLWDAVQLEIERRQQFMEKHGLRTMGRHTDEQPFTSRVICGECGNVFWRRTWYRMNQEHKVWQCGKRYRQKGVVGCDSENLKEEDLHRAFVMAWNCLVENRTDFVENWKTQSKSANPLQRLRATQMMKLTKTRPLAVTALDMGLVSQVLESVTVHKMGVLNFRFLDGTELGIEIND